TMLSHKLYAVKFIVCRVGPRSWKDRLHERPCSARLLPTALAAADRPPPEGPQAHPGCRDGGQHSCPAGGRGRTGSRDAAQGGRGVERDRHVAVPTRRFQTRAAPAHGGCGQRTGYAHAGRALRVARRTATMGRRPLVPLPRPTMASPRTHLPSTIRPPPDRLARTGL